ncbi:MAG: tyrosine-type recombinase/integrase, partial [Solirubrobacterales bacterium]|nr:tyrosine-type recombinase/integrase [Solirubrobacterales bacterium]
MAIWGRRRLQHEGRRSRFRAGCRRSHEQSGRRGACKTALPRRQLRNAHAVEMAHEGVPLVVIQRQLGHANLGITSVYRQDIDSSEIVSTVHGRSSPTISATAGL